MTYFNRHHEQARRERDTPERIVQIARARGYFTVSLRYRDDWLRRRCAKLRKQGLLRGGRKIQGGQLTFYPVIEDGPERQPA